MWAARTAASSGGLDGAVSVLSLSVDTVDGALRLLTERSEVGDFHENEFGLLSFAASISSKIFSADSTVSGKPLTVPSAACILTSTAGFAHADGGVPKLTARGVVTAPVMAETILFGLNFEAVMKIEPALSIERLFRRTSRRDIKPL